MIKFNAYLFMCFQKLAPYLFLPAMYSLLAMCLTLVAGITNKVMKKLLPWVVSNYLVLTLT